MYFYVVHLCSLKLGREIDCCEIQDALGGCQASRGIRGNKGALRNDIRHTVRIPSGDIESV